MSSTSAIADPVVVGAVLLVATTVLIIIFLLGASKPKAKFLNKQKQTIVLGERFQISHDTVRFRFKLPSSTPVLGLPVGKHFTLSCPNPSGKVDGQWNGRDDLEKDKDEIERKYTPYVDDEIGYVDLVVKVYKGGVKEQFQDGGKMSQYLDSLKPGDSIGIQGPVGMHTYLGGGKFKSGSKEMTCSKLGMMAGGTGITPMLQIIAAVLKDRADKTTISLLYANQTEEDILVRDYLEDLQKAHPSRLKLWYTLDRPPDDWRFSSGFITAEMIAERLPGPAEDALILMCGPPPMVKFACQANLEKLSYPKARLVTF